MISPEETASLCLNAVIVREEDKNALFFKDAAVLVFDGLIIWRGDLNMAVAIDRLRLLSKALGLPVAVIEGDDLRVLKRKKTNPSKFLGPAFWAENVAWDSVKGLDAQFHNLYDKDGIRVPPAEFDLTTDPEDGDKKDGEEDDDQWNYGCSRISHGGFGQGIS